MSPTPRPAVAGIRGPAAYIPIMLLPPSPIVARPRGTPPVLICRKCLSRVDDGKALKQALKSELKQRSQSRGVKRPRVVMTGCFGICPKRAVVTASAATLGRGEYVLVKDAGQAEEAAGVLMGEG
ncbi:putative metal-binding protein [Rhodopseudomonas rhenobacensis]|uniref:Putative metal-binding protein n=1 Tax=Rhodopseudomonas rhenobacensis TaxID=87461 RepID=A0A7W8DYP6_9BRAD|nr:putative metal-binding protein [Rhodopseudomonas rhenobacensis]